MSAGTPTERMPEPWIALRADEQAGLLSELTTRPGNQGLAYRHERPGDRDIRKVLWARTTGPMTGRPDYRHMHPRRQLKAMTQMLCQVCSRRASRTAEGTLFLHVRPTPGTVDADWPEGQLTDQPPLCLPCAPQAAKHCTPLSRHGTVAVRAGATEIFGVIGTIYYPTPYGLRAVAMPKQKAYAAMPYTDHERMRWVLASQLVRRLTNVTVIDLDRELAHAQR